MLWCSTMCCTCRSTHKVFSREFPHLDTMAWRRCTELKRVGIPGKRGVHLQEQALRRRDGKEARVDGEGGFDEGLVETLAP